ncbi:MAG: hypothetical protein CVU03_13225 [Bacteroidetes bacterium HGW-Bacteroidetes-2]|jgi:hypothetical protein|nr:MAG: hypothetical protein CVU03_13225 [Bacteroidetes bacterium HGW-Bacteroidetes-2]
MKKLNLIILVIFVFSIGFIIINLFSSKVNEIFQIHEKDFIFKEEYSGLVKQKYIDKEQHNFKTIIVKQKNKEYTILFDFVMGGLYEFIEVGDTLSKKSGTLDLRLKRKDLDTLITMQIYDRRKKN